MQFDAPVPAHATGELERQLGWMEDDGPEDVCTFHLTVREARTLAADAALGREHRAAHERWASVRETGRAWVEAWDKATRVFEADPRSEAYEHYASDRHKAMHAHAAALRAALGEAS